VRTSKEFLLLECESVRSVLQETLRFEYGGGGSRDFFDECEIRLSFIKQELQNTADADHKRLQHNAILINDLSDLIARIERSSVGEYSWPFVDEVKRIAAVICTENTLASPATPPTVHVLSGGGLDKYQINVEQKKPFGGKRRILTIVFPRSLKHFVLLHPVLGHELGHAIRGSQFEALLDKIVREKLLQGSAKFQDPGTTEAWLYDQSSPADLKVLLPVLAGNFTQFFGYYADWQSWVDEITCDLIGLVTFGPSFAAALCQLLYSLAPSGNEYSPYHPPAACRVNLILSAMRLLGYDQIAVTKAEHLAATQNFWDKLASHRKQEPWYELFTDQQLKDTLDALQAWLMNHSPARYEAPDPATMEKLLHMLENQVPPIGFEVNAEGLPVCVDVDFRHILYAGWVASRDGANHDFVRINRLCEHAIMQQRAISVFKETTT
jgi:hypothetical protein